MKNDILIAERIAKAVEQHGGRAYYVGGYVRDLLLGKENKDIDIEVHGVTPKTLEEILDGIGTRLSMGESFGIYGLRGCSVDIAMPRKEHLRGTGHRDFDVFVDPFIGTKKAAMRRDFTVNAMMQDVLTGEIVDHFGGREDLTRGVIRHVNDETFGEDALRVLRAAQFASRFEFTVAPETVARCRSMTLSHLAHERIEAEMKKALLKSARPSVFFEVLREMDQLREWFPELLALIGIPQPPRYHGEGDVWTHTMMVLDEGASIRERTENPYAFMLACVTHDFGKAICTTETDGAIHAYGHERAGLTPARRFLRRITGERKVIDYVLNLTELHMRPNMSASQNASVKSTNKLFDAAIDPEGLIAIAVADERGRIAEVPAPQNEAFLRERLCIYRETMARPCVMGKDLIDAGLTPGTYFTEALAYAHKLHLAGVNKDSALIQTVAYARKLAKRPNSTPKPATNASEDI